MAERLGLHKEQRVLWSHQEAWVGQSETQDTEGWPGWPCRFGNGVAADKALPPAGQGEGHQHACRWF